MRKFFALLGMLTMAFLTNSCSSPKTLVSKVTPTISPAINLNVNVTPAQKSSSSKEKSSSQEFNGQIYVMGVSVPVKVTKENELCKVLPSSLKGCEVTQKCISAVSKVDDSKYGDVRFKCNNSKVELVLITGTQATNLINQYRIAVAQQNSNVNSFDIQGYEAGATFNQNSGTIGVILQENPDEVLLLNYQNMPKEQAISILNSLDLTSLKIKN